MHACKPSPAAGAGCLGLLENGPITCERAAAKPMPDPGGLKGHEDEDFTSRALGQPSMVLDHGRYPEMNRLGSIGNTWWNGHWNGKP